MVDDRMLWLVAGTTHTAARARLNRQLLANNMHDVLQLVNDHRFADVLLPVSEHTRNMTSMTILTYRKHLETCEQHADAISEKIAEWAKDHDVNAKEAVPKPVSSHPCFVRDAQCRGYIDDATLVAANPGCNLKIMVPFVYGRTVKMSVLAAYMNAGPRKSTKCVYFVHCPGNRYITVTASKECDIKPYRGKEPEVKLRDVELDNRVNAMPKRLVKDPGSSAVRVGVISGKLKRKLLNPSGLAMNTLQIADLVARSKRGERISQCQEWLLRCTSLLGYEESTTNKKRKATATVPKSKEVLVKSLVDKSNILRNLADVFSEIWYRGCLFAEYYVWKCLNDGRQLDIDLSSSNDVYLFFSVVSGHEFQKEARQIAGKTTRVRDMTYFVSTYEEFKELVPILDSRVETIKKEYPYLGNVYKDLGVRYSANILVHTKYDKVKGNFIKAVCDKKQWKSWLDDGAECKVERTVPIVRLWRKFDASVKSMFDEDGELKTGCKSAYINLVVKTRHELKRLLEAWDDTVSNASKNKKTKKVVKNCITLSDSRVVAAKDLKSKRKVCAKPSAWYKSYSEWSKARLKGAVKKQFQASRKKHWTVGETMMMPESETKDKPVVTQPKRFSLMPLAGVRRTFIRIEKFMLDNWCPDNDVFERAAKLFSVDYNEDPVVPGKYIGSSFLTNGYEVHFMVERYKLVRHKLDYVEATSSVCGGKKPEPDRDQVEEEKCLQRQLATRPSACSPLVNTRNAHEFLHFDGEDNNIFKNGIYCAFDVASNTKAVMEIKEIAKSEDGSYLCGGDPGKQNCLVFYNTVGKVFKISQDEYYATVRSRNKDANDPIFNSRRCWNHRRELGYVPGYVQAAYKCLKSFKCFKFSNFISALKVLSSTDSAQPVKFGNETLTKTVHECLARHAMSRSVAMRRFKAYSRRQRMLDGIVQCVAPHLDSVVIVGNLYTGEQHRQRCAGMPAPCKAIIRHIGARRRVIMAPEFRTTIACSSEDCKCSRMEGVFRSEANAKEGAPWKLVHGAKYCPECKRRVNRDANAAKNILLGAVSRITTGKPLDKLAWHRGEAGFLKEDPWRTVPDATRGAVGA